MLAYADAMHVEPGVTDAANAGVLAGRRYVAARFWHEASLAPEPESPPAAGGTLVAFAQSTPHLVYLRALGDEGPELDAVLRRSVERVAIESGLPAVSLDRFRC